MHKRGPFLPICQAKRSLLYPKVRKTAPRTAKNSLFFLTKHSEYISLINELIEQYKDGTFVEVPNHHPPYPDDFPDAKSLPEATEKNVILCWRNEKQISENSIEEGLIEYVYIIDENHAIALEPIKFAMSDGTTKLGFANTLYLECDINSYVSEVSEGFFGENS